jgi:3-mercaptopyruvate sulfurtransferase SseA
MKFLKQYWLVLSITLLAVILVMIRTYSHNFRYDAVRWAEPSALRSNILTEDQIPGMSSDILLITLGSEAPAIEKLQDKILKLNSESILEKANLSLIRKNKGPVILFSDDNSVSARVWMVLSEMGIKNIFILQGEHKNELP